MKNNLGNVSLRLILFLMSIVILHAEDFSYAFKLDKQSPYVKEPVILTLDLNQTNHDVVMLFNFSIKESKDYTFQRIDIQETDSYHNAKVRYFYLLYPLKAGDINVSFDLFYTSRSRCPNLRRNVIMSPKIKLFCPFSYSEIKT